MAEGQVVGNPRNWGSICSRTCATSKHAHRVSQQDTELPEKESWRNTGHSLFRLVLLWSCWHSGNGTLNSLPFYRWLLTGSPAFLLAERSQSVIFALVGSGRVRKKWTVSHAALSWTLKTWSLCLTG